MKKRYNISKIISKILASHSCGTKIDISTDDRYLWTKLGCALKILGYDFETFFTLSHDTNSNCWRAWSKEKKPENLFKKNDEEFSQTIIEARARGYIVWLARLANMNISDCVLCDGDGEADQTPAPVLLLPSEREPEQPREPISEFSLMRIQQHYKETALYHWFCSFKWLARSDAVDRVFELYRIGGSLFGKDYFLSFCGTAFPYINREGVCYSCKLVIYNPETGKSKDNQKKRYGITTKGGSSPCLFGEHLLPLFPGIPVEIVESEKTALMAAIYYPDKIWMACGGLEKLNTNKLNALKDRQIILCPDRDGYAKWLKIGENLLKAGYKVKISNVLFENPGGVNDDICDLIVNFEENKIKERERAEKQQKQQTNAQKPPFAKLTESALLLWENTKRVAPALQNMERELGLTLLGVAENVDETFDGVHV